MTKLPKWTEGMPITPDKPPKPYKGACGETRVNFAQPYKEHMGGGGHGYYKCTHLWDGEKVLTIRKNLLNQIP